MLKKLSISGFSLIELLVVISIMAVLIGLSAFGLQQARESARDGQRQADLETLRTGLSFYKADCNLYPTPKSSDTDRMADALSGYSGLCGSGNTYIADIPSDPAPGRNYYYISSTPFATYTICASLETGGSTTATGCSSADCGSGMVCNYAVNNP